MTGGVDAEWCFKAKLGLWYIYPELSKEEKAKF
jgi:hypothetical protein